MADDLKILIDCSPRDHHLLDRLIGISNIILDCIGIWRPSITGTQRATRRLFQETWIRVLEAAGISTTASNRSVAITDRRASLVIDWQRQKKPVSRDSMIDREEEGNRSSCRKKAGVAATSHLQAIATARAGRPLEPIAGELIREFLV